MKKGKYFEEIVELIERSINPNSKVERDIQLPIIDSESGETTQCDIVITKGELPRQTKTIIEVQNRNRKPNRNTFWGWVRKLDKVSAQHLICVSKKGFSKSVQIEARKSQGKIMLVQLSEVPKGDLPVDLMNTYASYQEFTLEKVHSIEFRLSPVDLDVYMIDTNEMKKDLTKVKFTDKIFSRDKDALISLQKLCLEEVPQEQKNDTEGTFTIDIRRDKQPLYLYYKKVYIGLDLYLRFDWSTKLFDIPVSYLKYEQDEYGALAWLVNGKLKNQKGEFSFEMPMRRTSNGYQINNIKVDFPEDVQFNLYGLKK